MLTQCSLDGFPLLSLLCMGLFAGTSLVSKRDRLLHFLTTYFFWNMFLSVKYVKLRTIGKYINIAKSWRIFGAKTDALARISRLFVVLSKTLSHFKNFQCVKFCFRFCCRFSWDLDEALKSYIKSVNPILNCSVRRTSVY